MRKRLDRNPTTFPPGLARAATLLAVAAGLNTASVAVQRRFRLLTRCFGRDGWYVHLAAVSAVWAGFVISLVGVDRPARRPLPRRLKPVGSLILAAAGALWLAAYAKIGGARVGNGDYFGQASTEPVSSGVYRLRANPMYDSYVLALVGLALRRANAAYLLLAIEAALLLHGFEARIENRRYQDVRPDGER